MSVADAMSDTLYLTKSRYAAGLQCLRRLWLNVHQPMDRDSAEPGWAEDIGLEIGRIAHLLFPGGILVEEKPWEHAAAVARTAALMADRSVPAIFQAAFEHSGVRIPQTYVDKFCSRRFAQLRHLGRVSETCLPEGRLRTLKSIRAVPHWPGRIALRCDVQLGSYR